MGSDFKDKLKDFRKENKITQKDLATKLGVSRSNIAEMEAGRVKGKLSVIEKLAEVSGKPINFWSNSNIEFNSYDSIDVLFKALVRADKIKEDGKIPDDFKDAFIEQLEKEFALKYFKIKNDK